MLKRVLLAVGLFCTILAMTTFSIAQAGTTTKVKQAAEKVTKELPAGKININTADMDELQMLPGIGEKTADNIKKYIKKNGKFENFEQLMEVKNIGEKTVEKIKPFVKFK